MHNPIFFLLICALMAAAIATGIQRDKEGIVQTAAQNRIPNIGKIEILNGCGISGAADAVADFLRLQKFDVKNTGNAPTFNYPFTIVVSRTLDMTVAEHVAKALKTDKLVLERNGDTTYNVTIYLGPDFGDRIE
jgi:hypothetical protein